MLNHLRTLPLLALILAFVTVEAVAQQAADEQAAVAELVVVDSKGKLERQVAAILRERFNLDPTLQVAGDDTDDLIAVVKIAPTPQQNLPAISLYVNSTVTSTRNDESRAPVVQILTFTSVANIKVRTGRDLELLSLLNAINSKALPAHVYVANSRIFAVQNVTLQEGAPVSANQVGANVVNVLRTWPLLLSAFREKDLVDSE